MFRFSNTQIRFDYKIHHHRTFTSAKKLKYKFNNSPVENRIHKRRVEKHSRMQCWAQQALYIHVVNVQQSLSTYTAIRDRRFIIIDIRKHFQQSFKDNVLQYKKNIQKDIKTYFLLIERYSLILKVHICYIIFYIYIFN